MVALVLEIVHLLHALQDLLPIWAKSSVKLRKLDDSFRVLEVNVELVDSALAVDEQVLFGEIAERTLKRLEWTLVSEVEGVLLADLLCFLDHLQDLFLAGLVLLLDHFIEFLELPSSEGSIDAAARDSLHRVDVRLEGVPRDALAVCWSAVHRIENLQFISKVNIELLQIINSQLWIEFSQFIDLSPTESLRAVELFLD